MGKKEKEIDGETLCTHGNMYFYGRGVSPDHKKAFDHYMKGAQQDHPGCQCNLGNMYFSGDFVSKDLKEAAIWYKKASEKNDPTSMCNLGTAYANGYGVEKDLDKALLWYQKAADKGFALAQYKLGMCLYDMQGSLKKTSTKALFLIKQAANSGLGAAQFFLGELFFKGEKVPQDYQLAYMWFDLAIYNDSSFLEEIVLVRNICEGKLTKEKILEAKKFVDIKQKDMSMNKTKLFNLLQA